ncbi:DUF6226 family protein [Actinoplanes sp. OR16]|uniref:DUF6226 family protein n=1 Tax=Actinoplanes sp. OR16 TaxID=946334 RepID=UPI000FD88ECF|nr:DUF6226 family protein [Actinoplanes sp. OR16]
MGEVRERVAARYAELDLPAWANPHADEWPTRDESEYSRVTDPQRYRIVAERARLWVEALAGLPGVGRTDPAAGHTVLTSAAPGALPIHVFVDEDPPAALRLGVGRPEIVDDPVPDCACDACDFGSVDLLEAIDDGFADLVGGPVVVLTHRRWQARWFGAGDGHLRVGGASPPEFWTVQAWCERLAAGREVALPGGTEAQIGRTFLPGGAVLPDGTG